MTDDKTLAILKANTPGPDPDQPPEIRALQREVDLLNRRLREQEGGEGLIIQAVQQVFEANPPDLVVPPRPAKGRRKAEEVALLHLTDAQGGKLTDSYSTSVLDRRMRVLLAKVRRISETRRSAASINELVVLLGGDMVEGENIYPHQAHELEMSVFDQAVRIVPEIFGRLLLGLVETFPKVRVYCVSGNHGRPAPKSVGSHPKTNWDRVLYEYLKATLLGTEWRPRRELAGRLSIDVADTWYRVFNIWDWGGLLIHGHEITGGFAGFPWYPTGRRAAGWIDVIWQEPWEYLYMGHFHQYASAVLNHRTFFCSGTTESSNVYAASQLASAGFPCQRLQFFDEAEGIISDHQLYLDEGERVPQRVRPTLWMDREDGG